MGQSLHCETPRLSESQLEALCRRMCDAADHMADEQILRLADALHDALRARRQLRRRFHRHIETRVCGGAAV